MSRSRRKPSSYVACGAQPSRGKCVTSRRIRRRVKQLLNVDQEEFDFACPFDKIRGSAGSRDWDFGWHFFGDGRYTPYDIVDRWDKELVEKLSRK